MFKKFLTVESVGSGDFFKDFSHFFLLFMYVSHKSEFLTMCTMSFSDDEDDNPPPNNNDTPNNRRRNRDENEENDPDEIIGYRRRRNRTNWRMRHLSLTTIMRQELRFI